MSIGVTDYTYYTPPCSAISGWIRIKGGNGLDSQQMQLLEAGGVQTYRTQYDIAVDGTRYALGANKGLGIYEFKYLQAPGSSGCLAPLMSKDGENAIPCRTKDFLKSIIPGGKLTNRYITVTVADNIFSGYVQQATQNVVEDNDGTITLVGTIRAIGQWVK